MTELDDDELSTIFNIGVPFFAGIAVPVDVLLTKKKGTPLSFPQPASTSFDHNSIFDECFGGKTDPRHIDELRTVTETLDTCKTIWKSKCKK